MTTLTASSSRTAVTGRSCDNEYPPQTVKECYNTSVLGLRFRTDIGQKWR
ncbi:MAG: DUF7386 family protein [Halobacteriota archaeon]